MVPSFSVAKSFTSALIGIAIDEGFIESVDDSVTMYLPELAERDPRFNDMTIRHLLLNGMGVALFHVITNGQYGFHRDELDFIMNARRGDEYGLPPVIAGANSLWYRSYGDPEPETKLLKRHPRLLESLVKNGASTA